MGIRHLSNCMRSIFLYWLYVVKKDEKLTPEMNLPIYG